MHRGILRAPESEGAGGAGAPADKGKEPTPADKKPADDLEDYVVAGKKFSIPKAFRSVVDAITASVKPPKAADPPPKAKAKPRVEDADDDGIDYDELFVNPRKFFKAHNERIRAEVTQEIAGKYNKDQNRKTFWAQFYKDNPDLINDSDIVELVFARNQPDLEELELSAAAVKIAELAKARIMKLSGKSAKDKPKQKTELEAGYSLPGAPTAAAKDDDGDSDKEKSVVTLGDILRQRREKRAASRSTGSAKAS